MTMVLNQPLGSGERGGNRLSHDSPYCRFCWLLRNALSVSNTIQFACCASTRCYSML
ncbi:hypothetical protein PISMIDRAFT_672317, partial [Pisolithus microcarpus 441]